MSRIENISLFIPRVYVNYTEEMVKDAFEERIGSVKNVDFIIKSAKDGTTYHAAYIHFYEWYDTEDTRKFQELVRNPEKEARIVYDKPWYWIVLENKSKKHIPGQRKPTIDIDAFSGPAHKTDEPTKSVLPPLPLESKKWCQAVASSTQPVMSQKEIDLLFEEMEQDAMMDQLEQERKAEDEHLATFDTRYVQTIEQENAYLRSQVDYFNKLYTTETVKTTALLEAISAMKRVEFDSVKK